MTNIVLNTDVEYYDINDTKDNYLLIKINGNLDTCNHAHKYIHCVTGEIKFSVKDMEKYIEHITKNFNRWMELKNILTESELKSVTGYIKNLELLTKENINSYEEKYEYEYEFSNSNRSKVCSSLEDLLDVVTSQSYNYEYIKLVQSEKKEP